VIFKCTSLNTIRQKSQKRKKPKNFSIFSTFSFTKMQNIQDRQRTCTWKIDALSRNLCFCSKSRSKTYSEFVSVALVIQHAKCMPHIILSVLACLALLYFSTLSHKINDSRNNVIELFFLPMPPHVLSDFVVPPPPPAVAEV